MKNDEFKEMGNNLQIKNIDYVWGEFPKPKK